jgi:hypothetical protein
MAYLTEGTTSDSENFGDWEEDVPNCGVCGKVFGPFLFRHHCRVCGRCVCAHCSPSSVLLPGHTRVERACTPCVYNAQRCPAVKRRLGQLSRRIFEFSGSQASHQPKDLEQATVLCETAFMHHEEAYSAMKLQLERIEAENVMEQQAGQELASQVFLARDFIYQLGERLHALHGGPVPSAEAYRQQSFRAGPQSFRASELGLEEAMAFCEAALGPLKEAVSSKPGGTPRAHRRASAPTVLQQSSIIESVPSEAATPRRTCSDAGYSSGVSPLLADLALNRSVSSHATSHDACHKDVVWEENTATCGICDARLGKRFFKRRHHCRMCGKCVCSSCSPSSILLDGEKQPQRTCKRCVNGFRKTPALKRRVAQLAERLSLLATLDTSKESNETQVPEDLEQAVSMCESLVEGLKGHASLLASVASSPKMTPCQTPKMTPRRTM